MDCIASYIRKIAKAIKEDFHVLGARIFFKAPDPEKPEQPLTLEKEVSERANFQWVDFQLLFSVRRDKEIKYYIYDTVLRPDGKEKGVWKVFESDSDWSGKNKDNPTKDLTPEEVKAKFPEILRGPELNPVKLDEKKAPPVYVNLTTKKSYSSEEFKKYFGTDYYIVIKPGRELINPLGELVGIKGTSKKKAFLGAKVVLDQVRAPDPEKAAEIFAQRYFRTPKKVEFFDKKTWSFDIEDSITSYAVEKSKEIPGRFNIITYR